MSVIGRLRILMSADSAQIVSDLGKARTAVRSAARDMGGNARDATKSLTTEMGKFSTKVQGAPGAISAATAIGLLLAMLVSTGGGMTGRSSSSRGNG